MTLKQTAYGSKGLTTPKIAPEAPTDDASLNKQLIVEPRTLKMVSVSEETRNREM